MPRQLKRRELATDLDVTLRSSVPCALSNSKCMEGGVAMAKKTVVVSDISGAEIEDGKGARVTIRFDDARRPNKELDVTIAEAEQMGGRTIARRGRRPREQAAA